MKTRTEGMRTCHATHVRVQDGTSFTVKAVMTAACPPNVWLSTEDRLHVLSPSDARAFARALIDAADEVEELG